MNLGNDVIISEDVYIKHPKLFKVGSHVAIDKGFYCTTSFELGDYVHVGPFVTCIGNPKGKFVAKGFNNIMAGVRLICGSNKFDSSGLHGALIPEEFRGDEIHKPIILEPFSNIGTNSVILCGSTIRMGVLVSVGSVLSGDTEEWGVYKGNPAKIVKKIDGKKIIKNAKNLGYNLNDFS